MEIDLEKEIYDHLVRCRELAEHASDIETDGETLSSRASAMTALSNLLRDLVKTQEKVVNQSRLLEVERILIETTNEFLSEEQRLVLLDKLRKRVGVQ